MLRQILTGAIAAGAVGSFANSAQAFQVGIGFDYNPYNGTAQIPSSYPTPNSDAASSNFLASLTNPTTQDFNSFALGSVKTLPLNFGNAGTATFQGQGTILIGSDYPNNNNSQLLAIGNRTATPDVPGSTFNEIDFSNPIGALGFYEAVPQGITFSPTNLELTEIDGTTKQIALPVDGQTGLTSVSYFDVTAQNLSEQFTKVRFLGEFSRIQGFALGNITAASFDQIKKPTPVPEPTTVLGTLSAIAFGVVLRRKFKK